MPSPKPEQQYLDAFRPPHTREPWDPPKCSTAWIHGKLAVMKGSEQGSGQGKKKLETLYKAAKFGADYDAATELVDALWRPAIEEQIVDAVIRSNVSPYVVFPHPGFNDEDAIDHDAGDRTATRNAIPAALAERVRSCVAGFTTPTIKQAARVGRSKLSRMCRFVYQPSFTGVCDPTRPYILVDDTFTLGGTLAVLRSYIRRNGGTVIGVTALSHKAGKSTPFAMRDDTYGLLLDMYGPELVESWKEEIGHEPARFTDAEGRFLLEWGEQERSRGEVALLQRLRTRLDRARTRCE